MSAGGEWVTLAVLGRTRGNRGEVTAIPLSGKPERFQELREVYLQAGSGEPQPAELESAWFHDRTLILKFRGVDTISDAASLSGAELRVPASQRAALDAGEFYQSDLIGCEVVDRTGRLVGKVREWQDAGGAGVLELDNGLLIPFARNICIGIDPAAGRITVELPPGLEDLNRP
ncbi:MAG TPA: ribosome maturation factor RimM [Verrucomicrobiae bacterium]|nr:ribosome maturation factor RimM [Verrucomicrobiae bacterium]